MSYQGFYKNKKGEVFFVYGIVLNSKSELNIYFQHIDEDSIFFMESLLSFEKKLKNGSIIFLKNVLFG